MTDATLAARLAAILPPAPRGQRASGISADAMVATGLGEIAARYLRAGDTVFTRDHGLRTIHAISHELPETRSARAVRIAAGALGPDLPMRDMVVAETHKVLVTSDRMMLVLGTAEAFAQAGDLVGRPGIGWADAPRRGWVSILLDSHELALVDGAWVETEGPQLAGGRVAAPGCRVLRRFEAQLAA
ncbi:hypothetical protein E2L08_03030 [Palleronia sediminis]|uniref:Hedgehog/Intein (Hint) domain-containing protein n=1 Tax=Palleronia sediminis TaxID=2547833 RepID=A0A4R6ANV5_9RHOB|nr:Hint domain-containing protein [Palleronia sediminis]TDL83636.1 hypothetical protein E2L08_03030 [Palleronia sediminis]